MFRKILIRWMVQNCRASDAAAMALARQSHGEILLLRVPVFETAGCRRLAATACCIPNSRWNTHAPKRESI